MRLPQLSRWALEEAGIWVGAVGNLLRRGRVGQCVGTVVVDCMVGSHELWRRTVSVSRAQLMPITDCVGAV